MRDKLKLFDGEGLFQKPLSTSNLYTPSKKKVKDYLSHYNSEEELFKLLEYRLCEYHSAKHCVLFSTGFWALVAAIKLKAIPGKEEVIIPSLTYRRLADVVYWAGLVPTFVDIEKESLAICPKAIKESIGDNTALILAVHPIVNCCNVKDIISLSENSNIPVIFDAVESVHETFKGKKIGSFGVGEVFSMHASKFINGQEGGYICTDDSEYAQALDSFKRGKSTYFNGVDHIGLNGLPSAGHAAFALAGFDEIQANVDHNREVYYRYIKELKKVPGINLISFDESEQTSYKNIVAEVDESYPLSRDSLVDVLNKELVLARKYYTPALHNKSYRYKIKIQSMKNTDFAEGRYINLPCGARMRVEDVDVVTDLLLFISKNSEAVK